MSRGISKSKKVAGTEYTRTDLLVMYQDGNSIPEVSGKTGIHRSTIRTILFRLGALRSRGDGVRIAASKGRLGAGFRGKTRVFTAAHKDAIRQARLAHGEKHAAGLSIKPSGYAEVTRGKHKGRGVHRVVAEKLIGRGLTTNEHVHHIDGDKLNNEPSNLAIMTASEHARLHAKENYPNRERNKDGTWR